MTLPQMQKEVANSTFDIDKIRADFPILHQQVNGKPLVYLDSAASSQKPSQVINALSYYYENDHANVHRGVHTLSQRATDDFENARFKVQAFINAASPKEIIFVRGATEGINLVASSYGRSQLKAGDEILLSELEHHSNIVPWQLIAEQTGAKINVIPVLDDGSLDLDQAQKLINDNVKIVAVNHISNALGTVNPIKQIAQWAHAVGAVIVVDGAQAIPHAKVDVQDLDCDFYIFSGHKMYGPTGIGVVYGKEALLDAMPPYHGGGEMIRTVTFEKSTYAELPAKFEAGTPNIAGTYGLGAAVDYINSIGIEKIGDYEDTLLAYAQSLVESREKMTVIGTSKGKASILSFVLDGVHPHDAGTILDHEGIAVRTGHHCTQPLMKRFNVPATIRASFSLYNTKQEIDSLFAGIDKTLRLFA